MREASATAAPSITTPAAQTRRPCPDSTRAPRGTWVVYNLSGEPRCCADVCVMWATATAATASEDLRRSLPRCHADSALLPRSIHQGPGAGRVLLRERCREHGSWAHEPGASCPRVGKAVSIRMPTPLLMISGGRDLPGALLLQRIWHLSYPHLCWSACWYQGQVAVQL